MMIASLSAWVDSTRPKTLILSVVPFVMGTLLASFRVSELNHRVAVWAILSALCIQIATNLINEAFDVKKGADTENRLGPKRALQNGALTLRQVYLGGLAFSLLALLFGIPLVQVGGVPIFILLLVSVALAYAYTGGPYPLAYHGLGELFVIAFFGVASTASAYFFQAGNVSLSPCVLGLQLGLLASVPIAVNNLRDHHGDAKVNKRTLVVRFGSRFGRFLIAVCILSPYILNAYWTTSATFFLLLLPLPVGLWIIRGVKKNPPGTIYNKYLALSVLHYVFFAILLSFGLFL